MGSLYAKKVDAKELGKKDVYLYHDKEYTQLACKWSWSFSNCPTKRQKTVMFNCSRYNLVWID